MGKKAPVKRLDSGKVSNHFCSFNRSQLRCFSRVGHEDGNISGNEAVLLKIVERDFHLTAGLCDSDKTFKHIVVVSLSFHGH
jgi:hypothetical protein